MCICISNSLFLLLLTFIRYCLTFSRVKRNFVNFYFESAAHSYDDTVVRVKRSSELIVVCNYLFKTLLYFRIAASFDICQSNRGQ